MKAKALNAIRSEMADACKQAGRPLDAVKLIAVSKTNPWEDVAEFLQLGQADFGENYMQEALEKIEALAHSPEGKAQAPRWHFIGNLQSNKAKHLPGKFHLFHALDSLSLAQKLNQVSAG